MYGYVAMCREVKGGRRRRSNRTNRKSKREK
jgi:hypothetical protein